MLRICMLPLACLKNEIYLPTGQVDFNLFPALFPVHVYHIVQWNLTFGTPQITELSQFH